jgi:pimeloyl-ACP methyl ester carboxylesterase
MFEEPLHLIPRHLRKEFEKMLGVRLDFANSLDQLNPIERLFHWQAVAPELYPLGRDTHARESSSSPSGMTADSLALGASEEATIRAFLKQHEEGGVRESKRVEDALKSLRGASIETPDGQVLHYCVGGSGKRTLVLVNAYGQSLGYWTKLIANLLEQHRVIVWFARGSERQTVGAEQYNPLGVHVEDLNALLRHEEVEQCDLLGWCTGPKLMLEYYARHPERVATMTFLTGAFKNFNQRTDLETAYEKDLEPLFGMVNRLPHLAGPLKDTLKGVLLARKTDAASVSLGNGNSHQRAWEMLSTVNASLQSLVVEPFATEQSVRNYARQVLEFWEQDISSLLPRVRVPVLLISGECDKIASPQMSKAVAELIPRAKYLEVSGGSHYLLYERHELVTEIVNGFLKHTWDFDFKRNLLKSC